jgi:hypothetical protein
MDRRHEALVDADPSFSTLATGARQLVVHGRWGTICGPGQLVVVTP